MDLPSRLVIPDNASPDRADRLVTELLAGEWSRSYVARLMLEARVLCRDVPVKPSSVVEPGDVLLILPPVIKDTRASLPTLDFTILHEDEHIVVVDKPAGLVVHPGSGRESGTLMDGLVAERPEMVGIGAPGRWGIVHRLDRDTSGALVVAKTSVAHARLSAGFHDHSIYRRYVALVRGAPSHDDGVIDVPLGRHPKDRKRISTSTDKSRNAVTQWTILERFEEISLLEIAPLTGRTHQIRVHLAYAGLPVLGDQVYGRVRKGHGRNSPSARTALALMKRQALHARSLGFEHPGDQCYVEFHAPISRDIAEVLMELRKQKE